VRWKKKKKKSVLRLASGRKYWVWERKERGLDCGDLWSKTNITHHVLHGKRGGEYVKKKKLKGIRRQGQTACATGWGQWGIYRGGKGLKHL